MDLTADALSAAGGALRGSGHNACAQALAAAALLLLQRTLLLHAANDAQTLALVLLAGLALRLVTDALLPRDARAYGKTTSGWAGVQRLLTTGNASQTLGTMALSGALLLAQSWVRVLSLRHFGLLFAFLLEHAGMLLLRPLQTAPKTTPLLILGFLLVAGVDADEYGALLVTLALLAAKLGLELVAELPTLRATAGSGNGAASPQMLLSLASAACLALLVTLITPESVVREQRIANDRASADGGVMGSTLWSFVLLGATVCQLAAAHFQGATATTSTTAQAKTRFVCSLTGLLCAVLVLCWQRQWLRCVLDTVACSVVLYSQWTQWRWLSRGARGDEGFLDTYRVVTPTESKAAGFFHVLRVLWGKPASRKLLLFLSANVAFMLVELGVGLYTNSLGLMGDAGHMLFDNGALVIGLVASYIGQLPPDRSFTYGYGRVEVLSGFLNSLLLLVVSFHLLAEAVTRFSDPPEVATDHLLLTSTVGLGVNLVGLFWFHDHVHSHSHGDDCGGHGHSHSHSHGQSQPHGQDAREDGGGSNSNMYGVYLHVLADTLGSVGVIVSSVLIELYEWHVADPVSSALISLLILGSTLPLLRDTARQLLQGAPEELTPRVEAALRDVETNVPGVTHVTQWHLWRHAGDVCVAALHLEVTPAADEQQVLRQTRDTFQRHAKLDEFLSVEIVKPTTNGVEKHEGEAEAVHGHCHGQSHAHGHSHSHGEPLLAHPALQTHAQPAAVPMGGSLMSTHENPAGDDTRRLAEAALPPHKPQHAHLISTTTPDAFQQQGQQWQQWQRRSAPQGW